MNVIVIIDCDESNWLACVHLPKDKTADEAFCAWIRKVNYYGWANKSNDYIIRNADLTWYEGPIQEVFGG